MKPRADFISERRHRFIVIRDRGDLYTGTTVAADAAAVVSHCLQQHGSKQRMIYRNVDGDWRELRHDGERFFEIADIGADDLEEILEVCGLEF